VFLLELEPLDGDLNSRADERRTFEREAKLANFHKQRLNGLRLGRRGLRLRGKAEREQS